MGTEQTITKECGQGISKKQSPGNNQEQSQIPGHLDRIFPQHPPGSLSFQFPYGPVWLLMQYEFAGVQTIALVLLPVWMLGAFPMAV